MIPYLFLIIDLSFAIFLLFLIIAFITGAPFVPSTNPTAIAMIDAVPLKKGMTVYDLGSGDGKLLFLAEKKGVNAVGIEINPFLVLWANFLSILRGKYPGVQTIWGDLWKTNVTKADVIYIYLLPWRMDHLAKKLTKECRKGTHIVSNSFIFPTWNCIKKDVKNHVYVFIVE